MLTFFAPELIFAEGRARRGVGLLVAAGRVSGVVAREQVPAGATVVELRDKALLPGLANTHSHTFQRLFRGRAEGRAVGGDTFWTWREQMYRAAGFVTPEDLYAVARVTFLEMALNGITAVGEFHYLHRDKNGAPYGEPNLLAETVIRAAESVGLRICLLRSAYFRAGFQRRPHDGQRRFYESADEFQENLAMLADRFAGHSTVSVGAAPHSIRAVPIDAMTEIAAFARSGKMPVHVHISEQVGENEACVAEYGRTPVELLADHGVLDAQTTLVHAIHLREQEYAQVAEAGATICSCPTTERNLGDGIFPADVAARMGIRVALGTDSQAQIDLLEDARQLEYHLRLRNQQRGMLDGTVREGWRQREAIGEHLLMAATGNGYKAMGMTGGALAKGEMADFFTVDRNDIALAGVDEGSLAAQMVFAAGRAAVRDVAVSGRLLVRDGRHAEQEEIVRQFVAVERRFAAAGI